MCDFRPTWWYVYWLKIVLGSNKVKYHGVTVGLVLFPWGGSVLTYSALLLSFPMRRLSTDVQCTVVIFSHEAAQYWCTVHCCYLFPWGGSVLMYSALLLSIPMRRLSTDVQCTVIIFSHEAAQYWCTVHCYYLCSRTLCCQIVTFWNFVMN